MAEAEVPKRKGSPGMNRTAVCLFTHEKLTPEENSGMMETVGVAPQRQFEAQAVCGASRRPDQYGLSSALLIGVEMKIKKRREVALTVRLNFAMAMLSTNLDAPDTVRLYAYLVMHSWGNWSGHAIQGLKRRNHDHQLPRRESPQSVWALVAGYGPCPFCQEWTDGSTIDCLPANWRWHINCMAQAYAADAIDLGDADERAWGISVLNPTGGVQ